MKIQQYTFGNIIIDNKEYDYDIILSDNGVERWIRKESHDVLPRDIEKHIHNIPSVIIIGSGFSGMMKISSETIKFIKDKYNCRLIIKETGEAVETFNNEKEDKIGFFHLTC